MSLRTGTEMISLTMIFNKLAGFYGLLAVLTGFSLSPLQLSMNMYSVTALAVLAFLLPHIRKQSPFECLALAWFYLLDTVVNTAFTSAFAITWFLAVSANSSRSAIPDSAPGVGLINEAAGFTSPKYNVSKVDVVATPGGAGQGAIAYGTPSTMTARGSPSIGHGVAISESLPSIMVVVILTVIRVYFILVTMSYARQVLRQAIHNSPSAKSHINADGTTTIRAESLFAPSSPLGQGWRGRLGRIMVNLGGTYWEGTHADDAWARGLDGRFKTAMAPRVTGPPGTIERERRARSGTGPPPPPAGMGKV